MLKELSISNKQMLKDQLLLQKNKRTSNHMQKVTDIDHKPGNMKILEEKIGEYILRTSEEENNLHKTLTRKYL